jgi:hypothetical protein
MEVRHLWNDLQPAIPRTTERAVASVARPGFEDDITYHLWIVVPVIRGNGQSRMKLCQRRPCAREAPVVRRLQCPS